MSKLLDNEIKKAKWVTAPSSIAAPVISRIITLNKPKEAEIALSALGFFMLYVNGTRVGNEYFMPSSSVYNKREFKKLIYPINDEFTYRCYYSTYDISEYLKDGENLVEICLGDGWYRQTERTAEGTMEFGDTLGTIFAISVSDANGKQIIHSDGTEQCRNSSTEWSQLFFGEKVDARIDRDKKYTYSNVTVTEVDTILSPEDSVPDRIVRKIKPKLIHTDGDISIYDAGENISGFAVITASTGDGEEVRIRYSEEIKGNELDYGSTGYQYVSESGKQQIMEDTFIGDGAKHEFAPKFVWHAFRYFEVKGKIEAAEVAVVHSYVPITSEFECSCPELNWLFDAYLRTQLDNMHSGVPSDCPHRERLGYTGDGQLCAPAAMLLLDNEYGKAFYRKWIRDIFDSQDKNTGHVNHTAPFAGGGGGPGGWGCAAITVPYHYYKQYGDTDVLAENYDGMKKWVDYLETRSENGLIVREEEGGWCLGDWGALEKTAAPLEPLVNTCLFMRSLVFMRKIATVLGKTEDIARYDELYKKAKEGVYAEYYDKETGSFAEGRLGSDVHAVYAGIGDERTFKNIISRYEAADHFDTGIFGTAELVKILLNSGNGDIAVKLMSSHERGGFGLMMERGATTVWEYWQGWGSHNHPMQGACTRNLITAILGITQREDSAAYKQMVIKPHTVKSLSYAKGSITLPQGKVAVKWQKNGENVDFEIALPENFACDFEYGEKTVRLDKRLNVFSEKLLNN